MSSLYVAAALIGTFLAVMTASLVAHAVVGDRRRTLELLQSQVGEVTDLRRQELAQPFLDRVIVPVTAGLGQKAVQRQKAIQRALPDVMDLLTISVEAGLGFDAALANVRRNVPGALSDEIGRMLQEMQLGVPRVEAFRHLGDRTDVDEL